MVNVEEKLMTHFPQIEDEIKEYVLGVIRENAGDFSTVGDIYEAVGEILLSASGSSCNSSATVDNNSSRVVEKFCDDLSKLLIRNKKDENGNGDVSSVRKPNGLLNGPICLDDCDDFGTDESLNKGIASAQSLWTVGRAGGNLSADSVKKLEKAEAKSKNKLEKKAQTSNEIGGTYSASYYENSFASVNQPTSNTNSALANNSTDIKLENFDVFFGERKLLVDANLTLVYGRRYGLVGRNGLGKTTLLKMLATRNLQIPSKLTVLHVEQEVNGDETLVLDSVLESDEIRRKLLADEKEIQEKLHNHPSTLLSEEEQKKLAENLRQIYDQLEHIEADKAPARAAAILFGLGFSSVDQKRPTKEFSGGWRMRLALARALFLQPDLLLLDEPTNMLDIKAIYWLENYLQSWKTTLLVVSHDRNFLNKISTDIIYLRNQSLQHFAGNYDNFEKAKEEKLKNEQREYEAQKQLREHVQLFIDRFRYNANRAALVQSKIKFLERLPVLKPVEVDGDVIFNFPVSEKINATVLQLDEISFQYDKNDPKSKIFENCSISADMESRICLVGENGAGKTTLLKVLTGDLEPTVGFRKTHRNLKIAYFTQHHVDQLVYNQNSVQFMQSKFPGLTVENYRAALGRFGVSGDLVFQPISTLSGGQKSRLALALICMQAPNFLILDEPTNHLDIESVEALAKAIQDFQGGVILVSHDERLIELVCKELWVVKSNKQGILRIDGGLKEYRKIIEKELAENK